ncbi:uncharacterized protein LOC108101478 [Drosophila ficusphila]|uniref:uncharacterized protein LOC108101478 n=1 Tax=Drosophila ficusphila TaxID=30025 RepID=UPI0007E60A48|nr:uncharacterized protein LOC108101478 [Drosophila ficusphila]
MSILTANLNVPKRTFPISSFEELGHLYSDAEANPKAFISLFKTMIGGEGIIAGLRRLHSPWTETGGNHLVRNPDYTVDAKEPPIRAPGASGASLKMCVAWRCPGGRQFGLC